MKSLLLLCLSATFCGCFPEKEVELQTINVQLVKIDTIYRHPGNEQLLTWESDNNMKFVSYEPLNRSFTLGSRFTVMVRR
jgi:hypothetical protein